MRLLAAALLAATAADAATLESVRVAPPAELLREGGREGLLPRTALRDGDRVLTGAQGRATVQLDAAALLTLGEHSELYVHSVGDATPPLRAALLRGSLRVDGRPASGPLPQDLRINAGRLRLRVYGADLWVAVEDAGETVCLIAGALEMQVTGLGGTRLDAPGDCQFVDAAGKSSLLTPDAATLVRKLARTDYAATAPGRWTVVVGSFVDRDLAEAEAQAMRQQGVSARVRESGGGTRPQYRLTLGEFDNRQAAEAALAEAQQALKLEQAWITEF